MKLLVMTAATVALLLPSAFAQGPDGSDVNKAIPVYFGQIVNDIVDSATVSRQVYSINLAKGQQVSGVLKNLATVKNIGLVLFAPAAKSVDTANAIAGQESSYYDSAVQFSYQVAAAGTYYIEVYTRQPSAKFSMQITAVGTPIVTPNPTQAGCLSGQVDYITYSLQLIAAGIPDEISIGGQKACASCTVKAPLYPEISDRIEKALRYKVNVDACYDSDGNIFQIKLRQ